MTKWQYIETPEMASYQHVSWAKVFVDQSTGDFIITMERNGFVSRRAQVLPDDVVRNLLVNFDIIDVPCRLDNAISVTKTS